MRRSAAMKPTLRRRAGLVTLLLLSLPLVAGVCACGGSTPGKAKSSDDGKNFEEDGPVGGSENSSFASPAPAEPCEDGSCVHCGEGMCPNGFYCDESAEGGAACSWLPECASTPTCQCVTQAIGKKCSCTERSDVAFLSCS